MHFINWLQGLIVPTGGSMTRFGPAVCTLSLVFFGSIAFIQWLLFGRSNDNIPESISPNDFQSISLNAAVSFSTMFFLTLGTTLTYKGAQLTCALASCAVSLIAALANFLISTGISPISTSCSDTIVVVHIRWAEWMTCVPMLVFILGHITQARPTYVFGAMTVQFVVILLGYVGEMTAVFGAKVFLLCTSMIAHVFLTCCIYGLTVSLSYHRFLLQRSRRTHTTVLNQTMIKLLGISTVLLWSVYPITFVLFVAGLMDVKAYMYSVPILDVIGKAVFIAILKTTHSEGETKRMEAVVEELKTDNELQTKFLRFVYHEIRNPFNSIMLGLSHLEDEEALTPYHEVLLMLKRSANTMNRVIGDVVELTQARGLQLVNESVCLKSLMASAVDTFAELVAAKSLQVQQHVPQLFPSRLLADPLKLKKVFEVLISNAVKFSPVGSTIKLSLQVLDDSFEVCTLCFSVEDYGPGVPEDILPLLFEPFAVVRPGDFSEDVNRGSGLGLCFAKHLTDLMGGCLTYSKNNVQGSTFTLDICLDIGKPENINSGEPSVWSRYLKTPQRKFNTSDSNRFFDSGQTFASVVEAKHFSGSKNYSTISRGSGNSRPKIVPHSRKHTVRLGHQGSNEQRPLDRGTSIPALGNARLPRPRFISQTLLSRASNCPLEGEHTEPEQAPSPLAQKYMQTCPTNTDPDCEAQRLCKHQSAAGSCRIIPSCLRDTAAEVNMDCLSSLDNESSCVFKTRKKSQLDSVPDDRVFPMDRPATVVPLNHNSFMTRSPVLQLSSARSLETRRQQCLTSDSTSARKFSKNESGPPLTGRDQFNPPRTGRNAAPTPRRHSSLLALLRPQSSRRVQSVVAELAPTHKVLEEENEGFSAEILIVDDVKSNQRLVQMILQKAGYVCDVASDGQEAVFLAQKNAYKLIFMDNVMPIMDGVEATRRIVRLDNKVIIVGVTGNVLQKDQQEFIQAGASLIIEKPANKTQLLNACNMFLDGTKH